MSRKTYTAQLELKADAAGEFRATIATLNVVDRDGDVIVPGAFKRGQAVKVAAWGHNWDALPVGMGTLGADTDRAWVDGKFFLDTPQGQAHYQTVKALGPLQEWSFGFQVDKWSQGKHEGQDVRFIEGIDAFEVSPVMLGAGIGTGTDSIKSAVAELVKAAEAPPEPEPETDQPTPVPDQDKADFALGDVDRLVEHAREADLADDDTRKALQGAISRLEHVQRELSAALKRTDPIAQVEPRNQYRRFLELTARHGLSTAP